MDTVAERKDAACPICGRPPTHLPGLGHRKGHVPRRTIPVGRVWLRVNEVWDYTPRWPNKPDDRFDRFRYERDPLLTLRMEQIAAGFSWLARQRSD